MAGGRALPKFRRPPLIEVVHGVQFRRLPMTIVHPGLFYSRLRERFPHVGTVRPLIPVREEFGPAQGVLQFRLEMIAAEEIPRAWFISADDTMLVQVQADRLLLNWRRGRGEAEYPHFEAVSSEFRALYSDFEAFAAEMELGPLDLDQCEMTYISHVKPGRPGDSLPDPAQFFRIWSPQVGPEMQLPLDDLSFNARYILKDDAGRPFGRLIAALATLPSPEFQGRMLQLELTVRGEPGPGGLAAVIAFHEMAHEQIVKCFAGITTPDAHKAWERWQ